MSKTNGYDSTKITLDNICGYQEEKDEIRKLVHLLNDYEKYEAQGVTLPRGLIFQGPPGTGKTLFAKAIAGECDYKFFTAFSSELSEQPISTLKSIFKRAEEHSKATGKPCIIYIDEIDKLVYTNSYGELVDSDAREAARFLLQKLDETKLKNKILVIASTNNYCKIPHALLRSGRFDKKILVDLPDVTSRIAILKFYINNHPMFKDINISKLALKTEGMSGADLKTLINNMLLEYVTVKERIVLDDFIKIINEMHFETIGKQWKSSKGALNVLAHEIGHALVSYKLTGSFGTVSAIKYGDIHGATSLEPVSEDCTEDEDDFFDSHRLDYEGELTVSKLFENTYISLGGKAGEEVYLHQISTGVYGDFSNVQDNLDTLSNLGVFGMYYSRSTDTFGASEYWREVHHRLITRKFKKYYRKTLRIVKKYKTLGLFLIDEIHKNNDVMSAESLKVLGEFYKEHKKEVDKKYKHLSVYDLDKEEN